LKQHKHLISNLPLSLQFLLPSHLHHLKILLQNQNSTHLHHHHHLHLNHCQMNLNLNLYLNSFAPFLYFSVPVMLSILLANKSNQIQIQKMSNDRNDVYTVYNLLENCYNILILVCNLTLELHNLKR